jgi:hypothetical protein
MRDIKALIGIFVGALILNAIWELVQMPLYVVDVSGWDCWILCLKASVWDAIIITGVYFLIDTPNRTTRYTLSGLLLILVAIFIEHRALVEGKWAYGESMPTLWGIGLSPLIQLPLLAIVTYELIRKLLKV